MLPVWQSTVLERTFLGRTSGVGRTSLGCALTVHYDIQKFEILNDLGQCFQAKLRKLCKNLR